MWDTLAALHGLATQSNKSHGTGACSKDELAALHLRTLLGRWCTCQLRHQSHQNVNDWTSHEKWRTGQESHEQAAARQYEGLHGLLIQDLASPSAFAHALMHSWPDQLLEMAAVTRLDLDRLTRLALHLEVVGMAPYSTAGTCHGCLRLSDFDTYPMNLLRSAESDARTQVVALALSPRRIGTLACWPTMEPRALARHDDLLAVDLVALVVDLVALVVGILRQPVVVATHHSAETGRRIALGT